MYIKYTRYKPLSHVSNQQEKRFIYATTRSIAFNQNFLFCVLYNSLLHKTCLLIISSFFFFAVFCLSYYNTRSKEIYGLLSARIINKTQKKK